MANADAPVTTASRYDSLDLLRGFAVMAIFAVNIRNMLGPMNTMFDPSYFAGPNDLAIDRVLQYAVDGKWIATFAVLFGAGLALLHDKAVAAGANPRARIVRRQSWLIGFGLVHMVFIWPGDILTIYGIVGFLAMLFLGRRSGTVLGWTIGLLSVFTLLAGMMSALFAFFPEEAGGDLLTQFATELAKEEEALRGGVADQLAWRAEYAAMAIANVFFAGPMVLGYMLTGVLLFRSGFLLARSRVSTYALVAVLCLGTAWTIDTVRIEAMGVWDTRTPQTPYVLAFFQWFWVGGIEGLFGALGYAALVNLLVRVGASLRPVSAAGRMAFTNYIACSLIGTTLSYGHAGALLGEVTLAQAMGIVALTWLAMLIWSPLWLAAFRFGPLEWLWRSLTYGRVQPIRR